MRSISFRARLSTLYATGAGTRSGCTYLSTSGSFSSQWNWPEVCSWGKQFGQSWRVSWHVRTQSVYLLISRCTTDNRWHQHPLGKSGCHYQLVSHLSLLHGQCIKADNIPSNSFITQATDFYGRNDLDMVWLMSIVMKYGYLTLSLFQLQMWIGQALRVVLSC